jgi:hypothetical protein
MIKEPQKDGMDSLEFPIIRKIYTYMSIEGLTPMLQRAKL